MNKIITALLLSLAGFAAKAQADPSTITAPPADAVIRQWLGSGQPRLAAWAAYWVGHDERSTLLPDVDSAILQIEASRKHTEGKLDGDWDRALLALLDPVIQLKGELPVEAVVELGDRAKTQKLILLDRMDWNQTEKVWLALYRPNVDNATMESRVAAEELARHRTAGFAVKLMQTVVVHGWVQVQDPGAASGLGMGFGSGCCLGAGLRLEELPWPQMGGYLLLAPTGPHWIPPTDATLLIGKPDPIYVQRIVSTRYLPFRCGGGPAFSDAIRSHLVGTLLGGDAAPFPLHSITLDIQFKSRDDYQTRVEAFVAEQQDNFITVGSRLTAEGLMTEEERQSLNLHMVLTLSDLRVSKAVELPLVVFREPIKWGDFVGNE